MKSINNIKTNDIINKVLKIVLLVLGGGIFGISIIMGADIKQEGIMGLINNLPNALPWTIMLLLILLCWKREIIGGLLVSVWGMAMFYFFNLTGPNQWVATFIITLTFPFLGLCLVLNSYLNRP